MKVITAERHRLWLDRHCELNKNTKIGMKHIGGDYIGLEIDGEYCEVGGFAQHIIWQLLKRLES